MSGQEEKSAIKIGLVNPKRGDPNLSQAGLSVAPERVQAKTGNGSGTCDASRAAPALLAMTRVEALTNDIELPVRVRTKDQA